MNRITRSLPLFFFVSIMLLGSCSEKTRMGELIALDVKTSKPKPPPVYNIIILHDTIPGKQKPLTDLQKAALLDKFYDYGYKKYYGPRFDKLESAFLSLSTDYNKLGDYMAISRKRTDSIIRERNWYRQNYYNSQADILARIKQQNEYTKQQIAQNAKKIKEEDFKDKLILIIMTILIIGYVVFSFYFRRHVARLSKLEQSVNQLKKELGHE